MSLHSNLKFAQRYVFLLSLHANASSFAATLGGDAPCEYLGRVGVGETCMTGSIIGKGSRHAR